MTPATPVGVAEDRGTPFAAYAVAVLCAVISVLARLTLDPVWGMRFPFLTFYPAVALSAWYGGLRPGLVATLLCAVAAAYFWLPSTRNLWAQEPADLIALVLFLSIGVLLSALNEALHRRRRQVLRSEEALRESEERMRLTLDHSLDAVIIADREGRIITWNPRAEQLFGWSRDEVVGQPLADTIVPPSHREAHRRGLAHYLATGEGPVLNRRIELPARRRDGTEIPVEMAITPVRLGGAVIFSAFLRDISTWSSYTAGASPRGVPDKGRARRSSCGCAPDDR